MTKQKITPKQSRFVEEYLIDLNATQAAIRAGYSANTAEQGAAQLLSNIKVITAVISAIKERSEKTGIDAEYVLRQSVKLHERCMQEVKPKMVKEGSVWVHDSDADGNLLFVFDAKGASSSLKLVGDHVRVGAFKKQIEHSGNLTIEGIRKELYDKD